MKKLLGLIILLIAFSCSKTEPLPSHDIAKVVNFEPKKCYCMYGWKMVIGNDTVLTSSEVMAFVVGKEIMEPVYVRIMAVEIDNSCKYPYYEILAVSLIE